LGDIFLLFCKPIITRIYRPLSDFFYVFITYESLRLGVNHYRSGMSMEEILDGYPNITPAQLFDALSYYFDNKEETDKEFE